MTRASEGKPRRSVLAPKPKRLYNSKTRSEFVKEHPFKIELLKSLVFLEKSSNALPELIRNDNKQLASLYTSYNNGVTDVIKSNGDRVFDSINNLRDTVTELIASQTKEDKTLIKALQVTTSTLQDMLSTVSRLERKAFGPRTRRPETHMYVKADKGRKTSPRRQNNDSQKSLPTRQRHQQHKLSEFAKSDKGRKATPRRQNNDSQKSLPTRQRHQQHKLSEFAKSDKGRKATPRRQNNDSQKSLPTRQHHQQHRWSEIAKSNKGKKAIHRKQKNKIVHTLHQLERMLSANPRATTKAKPGERHLQHHRDGIGKTKLDIQDHYDTADYGSKHLKSHKRRSYADLVTLLHSYNSNNFDNTMTNDFQ